MSKQQEKDKPPTEAKDEPKVANKPAGKSFARRGYEKQKGGVK